MSIVKIRSERKWIDIEDLKIPWSFTFGDHEFFLKDYTVCPRNQLF